MPSCGLNCHTACTLTPAWLLTTTWSAAHSCIALMRGVALKARMLISVLLPGGPHGQSVLLRVHSVDKSQLAPVGGFGGSRSGGGGFADSYGRDRGAASGGDSRGGGGFSDRGGFGDRYGDHRGFGGDRDRGFSDRGHDDRDRGFSDRG